MNSVSLIEKKSTEYFVAHWLLAIAAQLNFCAEEMGTNISSLKKNGRYSAAEQTSLRNKMGYCLHQGPI